MIAWELAGTIGRTVAGSGGPGAPLPGDLADLGLRAQEAVVAYTGLVPLAPLPVPEDASRSSWVDSNVSLLRGMVDPLTAAVEERSAQVPGAMRAVAGGAVATEIGALMGYMGRRVLGQYEVALTKTEPPPARLLLVGPNLRETADRLEAPLAHLLAWVMVHEVTHAVQFSSAPWLRTHLGGLVGELLASADPGESRNDGPGEPAGGPDLSDLRALVARARAGGLVTLVAGPERQAMIDRIQAAMALVEGHAEHVMDAAGAPLVPGLAGLRAGLERRRAERSPLASILDRVLGMDLKLRQYRDGKAFCDAVVAHEGPPGLLRAFAGPELLPTGAELADPLAWIARTRVRQLPPAA
ncbi:MAG TPA: zinc-dependent metalloprotease [Solirubrobacteraceae bacterium]|nr:zinc-dependent metalloprotease [Solirubrobacteraceae bacterium]